MKKPLITLVTALGLTAAGMALADDIDTDGDGLLSFDEVLAAHPDLTEDAFAAMDGNGDGQLDEDEVKTATDAGLIPPAKSEG